MSPAPRLGALQRGLRGVRRRLAFVFIAFGVGASLTWYFRIQVILFLLAPGEGSFSATGRPIFTDPAEMFTLSTGLAIKGGFIVAFPVLAYNVYRLLRPLLTEQQRRYLRYLAPAVALCYLGGMAFAYWVMLPVMLKFLLGFGEGVADPLIRITDYMDMAVPIIFWMGVVYQLPLIMMLLSKLRLVSYQRMKRLRRYVPATAFLIAAFISSTFEFVIPTSLIALFEVGLFLAWVVRPKQVA